MSLRKNISKREFLVLDCFRIFDIDLSLSLDLSDKKTGRNISRVSILYNQQCT